MKTLGLIQKASSHLPWQKSSHFKGCLTWLKFLLSPSMTLRLRTGIQAAQSLQSYFLNSALFPNWRLWDILHKLLKTCIMCYIKKKKSKHDSTVHSCSSINSGSDSEVALGRTDLWQLYPKSCQKTLPSGINKEKKGIYQAGFSL